MNGDPTYDPTSDQGEQRWQPVRERHAEAVGHACALLDSSELAPNLDELARSAGYSRFHFHRVFKCYTGVTPHAYLAASRARRVRRELSKARTVSDAIYGSGFNSNGHFYATIAEFLGMTPTSFRAGGRDTAIATVLARCSFGTALVAMTDRGVCAVLLGQDDLHRRLAGMFPNATIHPADAARWPAVQKAVHSAEPPPASHALPVRARATIFGERVRQALRHLADQEQLTIPHEPSPVRAHASTAHDSIGPSHGGGSRPGGCPSCQWPPSARGR